MHTPQVWLQKRLHLTDTGRFAVDQFLRNTGYTVILPGVLMEVFKVFDHIFGIALYHHVCNF